MGKVGVSVPQDCVHKNYLSNCMSIYEPSLFHASNHQIWPDPRILLSNCSNVTSKVSTKNEQIIKKLSSLNLWTGITDGGPQFGQPSDFHMHKVKVENFYAENTGDDALAFFNVKVNQPLNSEWQKLILTFL